MHRSVDQLITIFHYAQDGLPHRVIAEKTGVSHPSVTAALRILNLYLTGKTGSQKRTSPLYRQAAKQIRKLRREAHAVQKFQPTTNLGDLKRSFQALEEQVVLYVKQELATRSRPLQEENRALQEENNVLREELERLKQQGTTMSWLDSLEDTRKEQQ